jgi:hypothetical protein
MDQIQIEKTARGVLAGIAARFTERHEYRSVQEEEFKHLDLGYYRRFRLKFEGIGFRYLGDVENVTLRETDGAMIHPVMIRSLVSDDGAICLALYHPKLRSLWIRILLFVLRKSIKKIADFETEFSDGHFVVTSNAAAAGAISSPPQIMNHFCPAGSDPFEVLRIHKERIMEYSEKSGASPKTVDSLLASRDMQHRLQSLKAVYRGEIGGVTLDELNAMSPGTKEVNEKVWEEIERLKNQ